METSKFTPDDRRNTIRNHLTLRGSIRVEELAKDLGVSIATVRRDLAILEHEGFVQRTHGGAIVDTPRGADQAFSLRELTDQPAKRSIARAAAGLLNDERTVFLNDGTTVLALARELVTRDVQMTVATCGINIASTLSENANINTFLTGGLVRHKTLGTTGGFVEQMLSGMWADVAFIAAEGLDAVDGMTFSHEEDARIAAMMSKRAGKTVALATARKLSTHDFFTGVTPAQIDLLISDCEDEVVLAPFVAAGIKILISRTETTGAEIKDITAA